MVLLGVFVLGRLLVRGDPLRLVGRMLALDNLLVTETGHVKLADFGVARIPTPRPT